MPLIDRGVRPGTANPVFVTGSDNSIPTVPGDSAFIDAFARQRFSEPFTIFDSKQIWDDPALADNAENYPLFWDNQEISGSGTSTIFDVDRASTTLGVSAATAGERVRQTKQRFNYQPGKSQFAVFACIDFLTGQGISKEIGLFDENNGLFFRSDEGVLAVVIRSHSSGSPVDTVVPQTSWNIDKMDGSGSSGVRLNLSKCHMPFVDFEWLGGGRARFGWFADGLPVYCHELPNINILDTVYMSNPNLPIRMSIANDGSGGASTFEQVCSTVISEGGVQPNGISRYADIGGLAAAGINAGDIGTAYAICGIRLKQEYLSATVWETFATLIENSVADNSFRWQLHFNPTLTTGLTYSDVALSHVEFGVGLPAGDAITDDGTVLAGGYQSRDIAHASVGLVSSIRLGSSIDGARDEFVLSATPLSVNQVYFGGIQWREAW